MVRDQYAQLGFSLCSAGDDGGTTWELPLTDDLAPLPHFISKGP
jgi:hypothetical protein